MIANLKISSKIWLCMLGIALTLSLFIGLFSSWYFAKLYQEDTYIQTADSLQIGSQSLEDAYDNLLTNVIDFASAANFTQIVTDVHNGDLGGYTRNKALIQEPMSYLTVSNPLLESICIIGKNGEYYSLFTNTLKKESSPSSVFGWDLSSVSGITWLPMQKSPFIKNNDIIPVIIPLSPLSTSRYLDIAKTPKDADVLIVLMLSSKNVSQRLALSLSSYMERILYLADSKGCNLSLPEAAAYHKTASLPETELLVAKTKKASGLQLLFDGPEYSLYSQPLDFCSLTLVEILPKGSLHHRVSRMNAFILLIVFLGLALAALLSLLLSNFVTRPIKRLISNVQNIENNTYDSPYQMKYQDEIGRLNMAINSMYSTITQQFQSLKQSERAKYRSEIQLLSEQINPHFLYNTLECINMEVLSGHKETAAAMINSLGDFLRIGLSYGNEVIPVTKELTHVTAYIDIMNHRCSRKIDLQCTIQPELKDLSVLKSILQPLAENSIRHGFDLSDSYCAAILMPEIIINIYRDEADLILEVIDNGCGIDEEKANAALYHQTVDSGQKQHVGLSNIYQRLRTYYGEVSITFETIPYYKNTVRITIKA